MSLFQEKAERMFNSGRIIGGLVIFMLFITLPFLYNIGKKNKAPEPSLDTPAINQLQEKHCVEPRAFMRANHMKLLNNWRDAAVRDNSRVYVSSSGKRYNISLQNTCMFCHSNKKDFCDSCHTYMSVKPYCWDCHIAPVLPGEGRT